MVMPMTTDTQPLVLTDLPTDDISDAELEAIAEGMLKDVLARKASAQRKLDDALVAAMNKAEEYFHAQSAP